MSIRPDPQRAERNLRALASNGLRAGLAVVQAYPQDLLDVLGELDETRRQRGEAHAAVTRAYGEGNAAVQAVLAVTGRGLA